MKMTLVLRHFSNQLTIFVLKIYFLLFYSLSCQSQMKILYLGHTFPLLYNDIQHYKKDSPRCCRRLHYLGRFYLENNSLYWTVLIRHRNICLDSLYHLRNEVCIQNLRILKSHSCRILLKYCSYLDM
jgi:hypothetical protein